jgi:hypothetical protein
MLHATDSESDVKKDEKEDAVQVEVVAESTVEPSRALEVTEEGAVTADDRVAENLPVPLPRLPRSPRPEPSAQVADQKEGGGLRGTGPTQGSRKSRDATARVVATPQNDGRLRARASMTAGGVAAEKSAGAQRDPGAHARGGDTVTEHHRSGYDRRMERKGQKRTGRVGEAVGAAAVTKRSEIRRELGADSEAMLEADDAQIPPSKDVRVSGRSDDVADFRAPVAGDIRCEINGRLFVLVEGGEIRNFFRKVGNFREGRKFRSFQKLFFYK